MHSVRRGTGIQGRTLRTPLGTISGSNSGEEEEEAGARAAAIRQLWSLWHSPPEDWECQVLSALLGR